jgi:CRISPR/Cas system-associated exonuclease Cas4 (RecB family)
MSKVIRSSEIGTYLYCRRAWMYRRQGIASANQANMDAGTEIHLRHGRQVLLAGFFRFAAAVLLLLALAFLVAYCTVQIL